MDSQTATLIAAAVAAASSVATLLINSRLTFDRERRQALLRKEIDRLFAVEELAGRVVELAGSYSPADGKRERLGALFEELDDSAGRLARYRDVQQAVRDVSQACKVLFHAVQRHEDDRQLRIELNPKYAALTVAVDAVLRSNGASRKIIIRNN